MRIKSVPRGFHRVETDFYQSFIGEFRLTDGIKDDLQNISLFCRVNDASNRPHVNEYGEILNDDNDNDLSDWKYWFTALSIICGKVP